VIRVLYRWMVDTDRQDEFARWWHAGTLRIRESREGSLGSTLCRTSEDPRCMVGIARWRARADVERFWESAGTVEFEGVTLEAIEVLDELDDLTLYGASANGLTDGG
jgi:heme-degrading monooxygenase HmoA